VRSFFDTRDETAGRVGGTSRRDESVDGESPKRAGKVTVRKRIGTWMASRRNVQERSLSGSALAPRDNTGCVFGFVYFVQYDPNRDGRFTFLNPAPEVGMDECPAFKREFAPEVREGSLMIFPAFMVHRVSEQNDDERERITLAGNYFARHVVDDVRDVRSG